MKNILTFLSRCKAVPLYLLIIFTSTLEAQFQFAGAGPQPGDKYKEYYLVMTGDNWRVTDTAATNEGAQAFLPNPVLNMNIDDLVGATKAEILIDLWQGHPGTTDKKFRFNGNEWINIPELSTTPSAGYRYMSQPHPIIEVPLSDLIQGNNTLEGYSGGQAAYSFGWGQWGWFGVVVRVYYGTTSPDYSGSVSINGTGSGTSFLENPTVAFTSNNVTSVSQVNFLAYYDGYDTDGDGVYVDWQRNYHRGKTEYTMSMKNHVGTVTASPFQTVWNTEWVPDQAAGFVKLLARVKDTDGYWYVTDEINNLTLQRSTISVQLYKPITSTVPERYWVPWGSSDPAKFLTNSVNVSDSYNILQISAARFLTKTWGNDRGTFTSAALVNDIGVPNHGLDHFYKYDELVLNKTAVELGVNVIKYQSNTVHHGIEILWPGPALLVKYDESIPVPPLVTSDPSSQGVLEGQTASFSITALGPNLSYQWQKNNVNIPGANSSTYNTPAANGADNGAQFRCVVSNPQGADTSGSATLYVTPLDERVSGGQVLLYEFNEGSGTTINDVSGYGTPLNLVINTPGTVTWKTGKLTTAAGSLIKTTAAATKVIDACKSSNEITVEAWVKSDDLYQAGPARIVTLSLDPYNRNFTMGELYNGSLGMYWDFRLRTTSTDVNGIPSLTSTSGSFVKDLKHLVYTRKANGEAKFYINGVEAGTATVAGDFSNWNDTYLLGIANEMNGGTSRDFVGDYDLISVYNRSLNYTEVFHNYSLGEGVDIAPIIISQPTDQTVTEGNTATFTVTSIGTTPLAYQWQKNETNISGANSSSYTTPVLSLSDSGGLYRCIVTNSLGSDTSDNALLNVLSGAPVITQQPASQTIVVGDAVSFSVTVSGTEPFSYQWKKDDDNIPGANSATYILDPTAMSDSGSAFKCEVSNAYGSATSDEAILTVIALPPGPAIDVWFGNRQIFGHNGNPQRWVNLVGNVSDPDGVEFINYKLNGGSSVTLSMGPDGRRLENTGDFNIDIDTLSLISGNNTVLITAQDSLGNSSQKTITVVYNRNSNPSREYSVDWDTVSNIQNVVQIVDGNWIIDNGFLKVDPDHIGYDRSFAIGDVSWDNYEITMPFIIHSEQGNPAFGSSYQNIGMILRWTGHTDDPISGLQPKAGFYPYGAIGWYNWLNSFGNKRFEIKGNRLVNIMSSSITSVTFNALYYMKMEVRSNATGATYKMKWWRDGFTEPEDTVWFLSGEAPGGLADPSKGSILFICQYLDASFGDIRVVDLNPEMPVELTSFGAKVQNTNVVLNWETATEVENYGFEIERSLKAENTQWEKIGFLAGAGNSNSPKEYSFVDKSPIGGSDFLYRLKQIDHDGTFSYSDQIEVEFLPQEYMLYQNYPNPFNPATTIRFSLPEDSDVNLTVYNQLGESVKVLLNSKFEAGYHEFDFNALGLSSGVYFYRIIAGKFVETRKMMLLK